MDDVLRRAAAVLGLVSVLAVSACTATGDRPASGSDDADTVAQQGAVLQPGRPGEANRTLSPDAEVEAPAANAADVTFMQLMIPHHHQALEMSALARTRASDPQVASLARRIAGAQGPEIVAMSGWLTARDHHVPEAHRSHRGHDHSAMAGMLSQRRMDELAAAQGTAFDRLFLAGMTQHHRGAVEMAETELLEGSDTLALELAADIAAGQRAEIGRMADLRRSL